MNKKILALLITSLSLLLVLLVFPLAGNAEGRTVVYLTDGGAGTKDGSSAENAAGSLSEALSLLDLTQDCTVVVCGPVFLWDEWDYGVDYTGSVTFTSVYDKVDWRSVNDAGLNFMFINFVLRGATNFEYIKFNCVSGTGGVHINCGFNPLTIGYGVEVSGDQLTGLSDSKSIFIVGGYQQGRGDYAEGVSSTEKNVDIKCYSGTNILINVWSRGTMNVEYTGEANVVIGGDANIGSIFVAGLKTQNSMYGKTNITVEGNATVQNIYSSASVTATVQALNVNWYGGSLLSCLDNLREDENVVTYTEGKNLFASAAAKATENYSAVAAFFTSEKEVTAPETTPHTPPVIEVTQTEPPVTEPPVSDTKPDDETKPDETTEPASSGTTPSGDVTTSGTSSPSEPSSSPVMLIVGIVAVVVIAAVVVVIVIAKKKKK